MCLRAFYMVSYPCLPYVLIPWGSLYDVWVEGEKRLDVIR